MVKRQAWTLSFREIQRLCQQWKCGQIPNHLRRGHLRILEPVKLYVHYENLNINVLLSFVPGQLYAQNFFPPQTQYLSLPPHVYNSKNLGPTSHPFIHQSFIPNNQMFLNGGMMLNPFYPYGHQMLGSYNITQQGNEMNK
jgi:hypothetical protein